MIQLKQILAPTDFSEHSLNALRYASAFASEFGATVHVLHSIPHPNLGHVEFNLADDFESQLRQEAEREIAKLKRSWSVYSFPVECIIRSGNAFVEIVRYAKAREIDLIVMGTHGRGAIAHMLLGSVAEKVVRKAPCPVLTVRHPEHEFVMP